MNLYPVGSVHGRFQPLHIQHLEYILEAKKHCEFLWIGITQFNILRLFACPKNSHREYPINNPLTYFERTELISACLIHEGISKSKFGFLPFPIEEPEYLTNFLPLEIPVFTTICDDWNRHKIKKLRKIGYKVEVLFRRKHNILRGKDIREGLINNNTMLDKVVSLPASNYLKRINFQDRLMKLAYKRK